MATNNSSLITSPNPQTFNDTSAINCFFTRPSAFIFAAYVIINILLLLPLCIVILHHGLQQWKRKHSASSPAKTSHSDCFTYHMVTMEIINMLGSILALWAIFSEDLQIMTAADFLSISWLGQAFFHILTCVERYLAVVHPVTYLSLKNEKGILIRNAAIACVWLCCCIEMALDNVDYFKMVDLCFTLFSATVVAFCSLSVLCVLIRPGPGERGGNKERQNQSKRRAFYTIVAILGVLVLKFTGEVIWNVFSLSKEITNCVMTCCTCWFHLPSNLVLPLLFLQRAGKLECHRSSIQ